MIISFSSLQNQLSKGSTIKFALSVPTTCTERKIQQIKKCMTKELECLSVIQSEMLGAQIANIINNLPIGLGNKT